MMMLSAPIAIVRVVEIRMKTFLRWKVQGCMSLKIAIEKSNNQGKNFYKILCHMAVHVAKPNVNKAIVNVLKEIKFVMKIANV
jgi:hypothetical protein